MPELSETRKGPNACLHLRRCSLTNLFPFQFEMQHDEWQVKENISQLKQLMSDQNLQLLPDYEQRIQVLKDLGFIDEEARVQLKGKVACEVRDKYPFSGITVLPVC